MHIEALTLQTAPLAAQITFYRDVLGCPLISSSDQHAEIAFVNSRLILERAPIDQRPQYHLALNIPENQLDTAKVWIEARVPLIRWKGQDTFDFDSWRAHSIYFSDAAGNILELIARHRLSNARTTPFDHTGLLTISEIGVAVSDVSETVAQLTTQADLPIFDGAGNTQFTALGDDHGLLIVVSQGRQWYPESGVFAHPYPIRVLLRGGQVITFDQTITVS
ncbi:MAG: ring-cleaving dioxygenase [Anaerolineae bacterium]|jgi:catechol-2,3-dioxygenase|nr:ring-cleaving dioxygenase [Anaerolineae bacterium]